MLCPIGRSLRSIPRELPLAQHKLSERMCRMSRVRKSEHLTVRGLTGHDHVHRDNRSGTVAGSLRSGIAPTATSYTPPSAAPLMHSAPTVVAHPAPQSTQATQQPAASDGPPQPAPTTVYSIIRTDGYWTLWSNGQYTQGCEPGAPTQQSQGPTQNPQGVGTPGCRWIGRGQAAERRDASDIDRPEAVDPQSHLCTQLCTRMPSLQFATLGEEANTLGSGKGLNQ